MQARMSTFGVTCCRSGQLKWGQRTYIMGVVNVSSDSFSGDGIDDVDSAVAQAQRFASEGADLIDVGGESTRPNASPISVDEELVRVVPAIQRISREVPLPVSVDTYKSEVAREAIAVGAQMINDIWGLKYDPKLAEIAAEEKVPIILMSNQRDAVCQDIMAGITIDLQRAINLALQAGVEWKNIIIDPGIGFGKTLEQNLEILRRLEELRSLDRPILVGTSRKSLIGLTLNLPEADRLEGTAATVAVAITKGADIVRVHDVLQMRRICQMTDAIVRGTHVDTEDHK